MARLTGRLKTGDALLIEGARYRVCGFAWFAAPDGSRWCEWLLVPDGIPPGEAIAAQRHCWLSDGADERPHLWRAAEPSGVPAVAGLRLGSSHVVHGKRFRVSERDTAIVERVDGDVGGDVRAGARFDYAALETTGQTLSVEWDGAGVDAYLGRAVSRGQVEQWAIAAGTRLSPLPVSVRPQSTVSKPSDSGSVVAAIIMVPLVVLALMLESCDRDDDCHQRYNPQTGQYETVCRDGVRSSGGRSFGGWGGK